MAGYHKLGYEHLKTLLDVNYPETVFVRADETGNNPLSYHRDDTNQVIVVRNPIESHHLTEFLNQMALSEPCLNTYDLVVGLKGQAVVEQHIVTAYFPKDTPEQTNRAVQIFDSKSIDLPSFLGLGSPKGVWGRLWGALTVQNGDLYSFPMCIAEKNIVKTFEFHSLGTQSLFDGTTCGMHTAHTIKNGVDLIQGKFDVSFDNLKKSVENPVDSAQATLKAPIAFTDFLKEAWQDTFMLGVEESAREQLAFEHYFTGRPLASQKENSKAERAYVFTGRFAFKPLLSTLKLLVLFPLEALGQSTRYLKNQLLRWSPTHTGLQYVRSAVLLSAIVLHALTRVPSFVLRTVFSPIASAKKGFKIHPVFGVASVALSTVILGGLAVAFAPLAVCVGLAVGLNELSKRWMDGVKQMPASTQNPSDFKPENSRMLYANDAMRPCMRQDNKQDDFDMSGTVQKSDLEKQPDKPNSNDLDPEHVYHM